MVKFIELTEFKFKTVKLEEIENILNIAVSLFGSVFFKTWMGAICAHLLSLYSDEFKGTILFLMKMFPERTNTFYFRLDF